MSCNIPETQMTASQAIEPAQQSQVALRGRATIRHLKTATFHHQPDQALQPTISSLRHS